jgi:cysteine desulfurase
MSTSAPVSDIYLDHAATTPVDSRVLDVMLPFFSERFGNPSSIYTLGRDARAGLDWARETLAGCLQCQPREIVFTSGATESNNLALKGIAWWSHFNTSAPARRHIVVSAIEHHAVLHAAEALVPHGFDLTVVQPDSEGIVAPEAVAAALRDDTALVSVMLANNEIGTLQPIRAIADLAHARGAIMHTDAVQAAGALPLDVDALGVDLLSLSAHKFYGPKGVGLLYVRRRTPLLWQQHGGGQENTRRGGTENTPGVVGMAAALHFATAELVERQTHALALRELLIHELLERIPDARLNGHPTERLPNNVNISFEGVEGETILLNLDMAGVAASSGSACSTGSTEPSHVLTAIGLSPETARGSLRLTVGKDNTRAEMERAIDVIVETVARVREFAVASA